MTGKTCRMFTGMMMDMAMPMPMILCVQMVTCRRIAK